MKNKIFMCLIICICGSASITTSAEKYINKINMKTAKIDQIINEVKDVYIEWLTDNTTLYVGGDILIRGLINGALNENILWNIRELDGKSGVVELKPMGSIAKIVAKNTGRAEIIVDSNDSSYSMRHIVVNVENYPMDSLSQKVVSDNIIPIQSKLSYNGMKNLQVEVNKNIVGTNKKVEAVDNYFRKLALLGKLASEVINSNHSQYDFYAVKIDGINNINVELRVDKYDASYLNIQDMVKNIDRYNDLTFEEENKEESDNGELNDTESKEDLPLEQEKPLQDEADSNEEKESENNNEDYELEENNEDLENKVIEEEDNGLEYEVTQNIENIIILGGLGNEKDPFKVSVNSNLSSKDKIITLEKYINSLKQNKEIILVDIRETKKELIYKLKISNKLGISQARFNKINDFYIEIIIDKEDEVEFKPIISMIENFNKYENNQAKQQREEDSIKKEKYKQSKENDIERNEIIYNEKKIYNEHKEEIKNNDVNGHKNNHAGLIFISSGFAIGGIFFIEGVKLKRNNS